MKAKKRFNIWQTVFGMENLLMCLAIFIRTEVS